MPARLRTVVRMPVRGEAGECGRGERRCDHGASVGSRIGGSGAGSARRAVRGCRCGAARAAAPDRDGEEDGRRRQIGTARCRSRSQAGQRWTEMPSFMAFSTRLSVMPEPGNATIPFGRRFSSSSLRGKGAARTWVFQSNLRTISAISINFDPGTAITYCYCLILYPLQRIVAQAPSNIRNHFARGFVLVQAHSSAHLS